MIVVTGGDGFIGRHLCGALRRDGETVVVAGRPDFDWDKASESRAVFHLGAIADTGVSWIDAMKFNAMFSFGLLDWCQDRNIPLIYASSASVYGNSRRCREWKDEAPLTGYAWSKWLFDLFAKQHMRHASAPIVGLRLFNVYGDGEGSKGKMASPIHQFSQQIISSGVCRVFRDEMADAKRDFVHVSDVVKVMVWAWQKRVSGVLNVGTGEPHTFTEVAQCVRDALGGGRIDHAPFPKSFPMEGYQAFTRADLSALRRAGFTAPMLSLKDGISSTFAVKCAA